MIEFNTSEIKYNSNCISLIYKEIQVDLIVVPEEEFDWACYYYSNNDLGNLVGRISRSIGFKFGGNGFFYEKILISRNLTKVLRFLGFLETETYFKTLEDLLTYVTTSSLFDPHVYLLENRNFEGRHRDKNRPNYLKFLQFIKTNFNLENPRIQFNKEVHLKRAFLIFPQFHLDYLANEESKRKKYFESSRFNGHIVKAILDLEGKDLGDFIKSFKDREDYQSLIDSGNDLTEEIKNHYA